MNPKDEWVRSIIDQSRRLYTNIAFCWMVFNNPDILRSCTNLPLLNAIHNHVSGFIVIDMVAESHAIYFLCFQ